MLESIGVFENLFFNKVFNCVSMIEIIKETINYENLKTISPHCKYG